MILNIKKILKNYFTGRITEGGEWNRYDEFSASYRVDDYMTITAYYYQISDDVAQVDDLSDMEWDVEYYVVEETK